jgi:endonuclease-3
MYGRVEWARRGSGLDVLVEAMLSQNTNMANSRRGYRQLRRAYPTWPKVLAAPVEQVQRQIAICGLARQRARRLQALLARIKLDHPGGRGKLDLDWLAQRSPADAAAYLRSFHGIGPKTAAYTLLFGFDMPVLPVDNGILRVARRLRLVRPNTGSDGAEQALAPRVPRGGHYAAHVLMFRHAKVRCRPKNPLCDQCLLLRMCPHGQRWVKHRPPEAGVEVLEPRPKQLARFVSAGIVKNVNTD